jgi:phospholipid/cholesterol/gamma-HCH transport system substrate-binding protein
MGTQTYDDVRRRLADIERSVRAAASTTSVLGQELYSDRLYRQLMTPLAEFDTALARLQTGQGTGGRLLTDAAQYEQAAATIQSLRATVANLRDSPFIKSDALYTDLNRAVGAVTASVDQINAGPLFAAPQPYESLTGFAKELENTVRDFRQDPRKYLRLKLF